jgi:spore coat protein CotH
MKPLTIIFIFIFIFAENLSCQIPGSNIFNYEGIHDVRLTFTQPDYWDSLLIYKEEGDQTGIYTYMPVTVDFDGQIIDSTGVRLKGNSSYWAPGKKKSIKLKFNKYVSGQKLDGLKKVNLNNNFNDPTLMREKLFLDILHANNVYAPRCAYARVYINNVYWGLYTLVDHIDKVFLLSHFHDKSGNLFKGDKDPAMPCANMAYHPDPMEYRNCYTLETNEDLDDWSDLEYLIDVINHTPLPEYYSGLRSVLNTASFINAWATNIVFVNVDSYVETGHNYYTYHNPVSNKFEWITWDVNEAFGLWNVGMPLEQLYNLNLFYLPSNAESTRPLSYFMLQDPVFRKMYTDKVYELVCTEFNPEILFPKIEGLYYLIMDDVYADTNKIISTQNFESNILEDVLIAEYPGWVPGLKSFIQLRHDILMGQLSELGYSFPCTVNSSNSEKYDDIYIYPNPTNDCIIINPGYCNDKTIFIEILDANGQIVESIELNGNIKNIDISNYPKGIYFIRIIIGNYFKTERIIKF